MFSLFVIMCRIHSQHFQIYQIDKYLARILANTICENLFLRLLINLFENARECKQIFSICLFLGILQEFSYMRIRLKVKGPKWSKWSSAYHVVEHSIPFQLRPKRTQSIKTLRDIMRRWCTNEKPHFEINVFNLATLNRTTAAYVDEINSINVVMFILQLASESMKAEERRREKLYLVPHCPNTLCSSYFRSLILP